jgi:hypothetical protein
VGDAIRVLYSAPHKLDAERICTTAWHQWTAWFGPGRTFSFTLRYSDHFRRALLRNRRWRRDDFESPTGFSGVCAPSRCTITSSLGGSSRCEGRSTLSTRGHSAPENATNRDAARHSNRNGATKCTQAIRVRSRAKGVRTVIDDSAQRSPACAQQMVLAKEEVEYRLATRYSS